MNRIVITTLLLALAGNALTAVADDASDFQAKDVWQSDWNKDISSREDHKVLVIQERKFTKAKAWELGVHGGVNSNSAFYNSWCLGVNGGYHFSEYLGVEGFYNHSTSSSTQDADQINQFLDAYSFPSSKEYQKAVNFGGANVIWSPIYGKFAFFRSNIIHFDVFALLGVSVLTTESNISADKGGKNQTHPGSLAGLGTRVFLNQHTSLRLEMRNNIYRSDFAPVKTGGEGSTLTRSQFQFTAGVSYLFGN